MAVNIHITIIELNALHTKRQNLFQELDAVIHLLMEAKHWGYASLQRTFKKSFTSFSHSTRNKTRDGLIRVRNIRALNGRFNTSITHAYSIVIGSKHITLNATGG